MSEVPLQAQRALDDSESETAAEGEFETALRLVEARVDRRLKEAAELRHSIEQELSAERSRAAEQDRELQRLRLELKRMAQVSASTEAKLNAFEQMLEAVEDDIDERIAAVEAHSLGRLAAEAKEVERLAAENKGLRNEIEVLSGKLARMPSNWLWRTVAKFRRVQTDGK